MKSIKNFLKDESGQGLVEYGLIIGIVVLGAIGMMRLLGTTVYEVLYKGIKGKLYEIVSNL